jgi:hypothetical protein
MNFVKETILDSRRVHREPLPADILFGVFFSVQGSGPARLCENPSDFPSDTAAKTLLKPKSFDLGQTRRRRKTDVERFMPHHFCTTG